MRKNISFLLFAIVVIILYSFLIPFAFMEETIATQEQEDLSTLTYKELLLLEANITAEIQANHTLTDSQKNQVLKATQNATQTFFSNNGLEVSGWAWYDSEYTYTRDWDYYTLKTHLDYKNSKKKNQKAIIYAEIFDRGGDYTVIYLKEDNTVILDTRSDYAGMLWFTPPTPRIDQASKINLSIYSVQELKALNEKIQKELQKNHSVSKKVASIILNLTKSDLEQYCLKQDIEIKSYAKRDNEYTFLRDWDYYWLETHLDYKTSLNSSQKTEKLYSEIYFIDGHFELLYLKLGNTIVINRKDALSVSIENGIPQYNWAEASKAITGFALKESPVSSPEITPQIIYITPKPTPVVTPQIVYVTPEPTPVVTPQVIYVTPEPTPVVTPQIIYVTPKPTPVVTPKIIYVTPAPEDGIFIIKLEKMSDKQLKEAVKAINAEQEARKNRISKNTLKKILMFATCNDVAEDIFTKDGMNYDKKKLHDYKYFNSVLKIIDEGKWTTKDGGKTWHVRNFLVQHKVYGGFRQYSFDISFNGKNYILRNGKVVSASKQKWLDKSDPSKYGEDDLSNLEFYIYLTISPKQIDE